MFNLKKNRVIIFILVFIFTLAASCSAKKNNLNGNTPNNDPVIPVVPPITGGITATVDSGNYPTTVTAPNTITVVFKASSDVNNFLANIPIPDPKSDWQLGLGHKSVQKAKTA